MRTILADFVEVDQQVRIEFDGRIDVDVVVPRARPSTRA